MFFDTSAKLMLVNGTQSASVGRWIKDLRESHKLNQTQLAEKMGLDRSVVSKVEKGDQKATPEFVIAFARAIQFPVNDALLQAGVIDEEAYALTVGRKGFLANARDALEFARLLNEIGDADTREDAVEEIRTVLKLRASRAKARQSEPPDHRAAGRGK